MIETKPNFYVEMQKNLARMRVIMQTNDVLASLPTKICECVKSNDKDVQKYVELFQTKMWSAKLKRRNMRRRL
jgi:hypothetical protein